MPQPSGDAMVRTIILTILVLAGTQLALTPVNAQIAIPGLRPGDIVDAWVEGPHVILKTQDGRLYSIPTSTPGIDLAEVELAAATERPADPLTVPDIIDMLRAGLSEATIKAHIQESGAENVGLGLTKDELIELKQAGASEAFLQYLIRLGPGGPKITYIRWTGPAWPPRPAEPTTYTPEPVETNTFQEGIPLYPYVFPGYGFSYSQYPSHSTGFRYLPGYRSHSKHAYPEPRSIMPFSASRLKSSKNRHYKRSGAGRPKPELYSQGHSGNVMIRWNAAPRQGAGGRTAARNGRATSVPSRGRVTAPTRRSYSTGISSRGRNTGSNRGGAGRSAVGRATSSRGRSLIRKN